MRGTLHDDEPVSERAADVSDGGLESEASGAALTVDGSNSEANEAAYLEEAAMDLSLRYIFGSDRPGSALIESAICQRCRASREGRSSGINDLLEVSFLASALPC